MEKYGKLVAAYTTDKSLGNIDDISDVRDTMRMSLVIISLIFGANHRAIWMRNHN